MDLDALLTRYFGSSDLDDVSGAMFASGIERVRTDFGMEKDRGRRFALWTMMHVLGVAPDLDIAFDDAADRDAARNLMDLADRADP